MGYPIQPGDWIITEDGERLYFVRLSSTGHWGFFSEDRHHKSAEHKLPLAGLRKAEGRTDGNGNT